MLVLCLCCMWCLCTALYGHAAALMQIHSTSSSMYNVASSHTTVTIALIIIIHIMNEVRSFPSSFLPPSSSRSSDANELEIVNVGGLEPIVEVPHSLPLYRYKQCTHTPHTYTHAYRNAHSHANRHSYRNTHTHTDILTNAPTHVLCAVTFSCRRF